jgi:hypothetical protein
MPPERTQPSRLRLTDTVRPMRRPDRLPTLLTVLSAFAALAGVAISQLLRANLAAKACPSRYSYPSSRRARHDSGSAVSLAEDASDRSGVWDFEALSDVQHLAIGSS